MTARQYQTDIINEVEARWQSGIKNVGVSAPTGSGKTVIFAKVMARCNLPTVAIAHRQELVSQMSLAMAREQIHHRIIAPNNVIRDIIALHREECGGATFYNPDAMNAAAGVDTLNARAADMAAWSSQVGYWVQDEAHHLLKENKWGKVIETFHNAKGLGVSATWFRADKKGLGRDSDGVFDHLIHGPTMRELIDESYLCDYRVVCAESDIDLAKVEIGKTGDYKPKQLSEAAKESRIVGDVVQSYLKWAPGKIGITFATDIETATAITAQYNASGVSAELVTAKTPLKIRSELMRRFRRREIMQLVNVDLFGEGTDVPALEVVSQARPTASYGLFAQQFGRVLRHLPGKDYGLIIDHVGNIVRHGGPPIQRKCTLAARSKGSRDTASEMPLKSCGNEDCLQPYERFRVVCPYCGHRNEPAARSTVKMVDGHLIELDAATLEEMYADIRKTDYTMNSNAPIYAQQSHFRKQQAQRALRYQMAVWGGAKTATGYGLGESQKLFYLKFGVDILTAQALGKPDAIELTERLKEDLR